MDALRTTIERAIGNQYEVLQLIGRGGMGAVYLARERFLERLVAVKVLPHDTTGDGTGRERFLREARTAAKLSHPSIVPLHTFAEAEGTLLYVMGYVPGESLASLLGREGRLPPDRATRIMSEIADALGYAHSMGVVHRDVKPDNILIDAESGRAFLTDFGIAKQGAQDRLTRTGMVVGTPHYMSPEQGSGDPNVDGRSDLYALGVIGYQMVSGRLPFAGTSMQEVLMQHATREPVALEPASATPQLSDAIMRCLKKSPVERWQRGEQIVETLRPRDPSELNLPDDMTGYPSSGVGLLTMLYVIEIIFGWLHVLRPAQEDYIAAVGSFVVIVGGMLAQYALMGRKRGFAFKEMLRMAFWAPAWWWGWWPSALRRPGDVWQRLPRGVRVNRTFYIVSLSIMIGVVTPFLGLALTYAGMGKLGETRNLGRFVLLPIMVTGLALMVGAIIPTIWWKKRFKLSNALMAKLSGERTWNNPFWRRPEIEGILTPVESAQPVGTSRSPKEMVAAIDHVASALPEGFRAAGQDALVAARDVLRFIESADREIATLGRDADPAERARLEQRLAQLGADRSPMRQLLEQQLDLIAKLDAKRANLERERQRSVDLLRRLQLQLAGVRGGNGEGASVTELSGQIRAICQELDRQRAAGDEVERILKPTDQVTA